eukprot:scaffold6129_cov147-Isochrysis_galbana.AAC.3
MGGTGARRIEYVAGGRRGRRTMRNLIASWRYSGMPGFNMDPPGPPLRNASRNVRRARIAVRPTRYAPLDINKETKSSLPASASASAAGRKSSARDDCRLLTRRSTREGLGRSTTCPSLAPLGLKKGEIGYQSITPKKGLLTRIGTSFSRENSMPSHCERARRTCLPEAPANSGSTTQKSSKYAATATPKKRRATVATNCDTLLKLSTAADNPKLWPSIV